MNTYKQVQSSNSRRFKKQLEQIQELAVSEGHELKLEVSGPIMTWPWSVFNWVILSSKKGRLVSITVSNGQLGIDYQHVPDYVPSLKRRVLDIISR